MIPAVGRYRASAAGSTWNPADKSANITLSNGNLTATNTTGSVYAGVRSTSSKSTGKFYFEVHIDVATDANHFYVSVGNSSSTLISFSGSDANSWAYRFGGAAIYHNGAGTSVGVSCAAGDIIGICVDLVAGNMWIAKNNVWFLSGNPATGVNPTATGLTGALYPMMTNYALNDASTARFTSAQQTYTPPSGFAAWG